MIFEAACDKLNKTRIKGEMSMSNKDKNKKSKQNKSESKPKLEPKNINKTTSSIFQLNKKKTNS